MRREPRLRPLRPGEWALLRELRLRALRESPGQFGQTLASAEGKPTEWWERWCADLTTTRVMFLATDGEAVVGTTFGMPDPAGAATGRVGGMWVAPDARRRGVGRALLDATIAWCRAQRMDRVELFATEDGAASRALYEAAGFRYTGRREPFPHGPPRWVLEMVLDLG